MKKRYIVFPIYIIFIAIILLGIGYSALVSKLSIEGTVVHVGPLPDIRVTKLAVNSTIAGSVAKHESFNSNYLYLGFELPKVNSSITYDVDVTNFGNVEMGILGIDGLPSHIQYSLIDYKLKDKLCDIDGNCTLGAVKSFKIKIEYTDEFKKIINQNSPNFDVSKTKFDISAKIKFKKYLAVIYKGMSSEGYPTSIMEGDTLNIKFTTNPPADIHVSVNGKNLIKDDGFTYKNNVLNVPNVTGDVIISPNEVPDLPDNKDMLITFHNQGGNVNSYNFSLTLKNVSKHDSTAWEIYIMVPPDAKFTNHWSCQGSIKDGILTLKNDSWNGVIHAGETKGYFAGFTVETQDPTFIPLVYTAKITYQ